MRLSKGIAVVAERQQSRSETEAVNWNDEDIQLSSLRKGGEEERKRRFSSVGGRMRAAAVGAHWSIMRCLGGVGDDPWCKRGLASALVSSRRPCGHAAMNGRRWAQN